LLNDFYFDGRVLFPSVTNSITFKTYIYLFIYYTVLIDVVTSRDHTGSSGVRIVIEY
jgi:hypothetical protein